MNGILKLTSFFFNWHAGVYWSAVLGAAMITIAIAGAYAQNDVVVTASFVGLGALGASLLLALPVFFSPRAYLALVHNRHLALIPGMHLAATMACCFLLILSSLGAATFSTAIGTDFWLVAARFFVFSSIYFTTVYWAIKSRLLPAIVIFYTIFLSASAAFLPGLRESGWFGETPTLVAFAAAALLWILVLIRMRAPNIARQTLPDHEHLFRALMSRMNARLTELSPLSALLGYPTTWRERLPIMFTTVVVVPLTITLFSALCVLIMKYYANDWDEDKLRSSEIIIATLMITSFANALFACNSHTLVARTRSLWLRFGNREAIWQEIDRAIVSNLVIIAGFSSAIYIAMLIAGANVPLYLAGTLSFCAAWSYLSLLGRASSNAAPSWIVGGISISAVFLGLVYQNEPLLWLVVVILAITSLIARQMADRAFLKLDWLRTQASRGEYAKRSVISLW